MEMKTSVEEISPVKKKLVVEIGADVVDKSVNDAYRRLGKRAKIPGFRPGKVPRKIMERYFSAEVQQDVTRELVNETLPRAVEETEGILPARIEFEDGVVSNYWIEEDRF